MSTISVEAVEARRAYQMAYRMKNRERINARQREWNARNKDKVRRYNERYWENVAEGKVNIRDSWKNYGITPERLKELKEVVKSGEYSSAVLSAAHMANKEAAAHIILSVKKDLSYEALEAKQALGEIERIALGRTDFYGIRRLFFHYLDIAMKEVNADQRGEVT